MTDKSAVPDKFGRTRWDVFAEAIEGGWVKTAQLVILLVVASTPPCAGGVLVFRLMEAYLRHR